MPLLDPVSAAWNTVARFEDYERAQPPEVHALCRRHGGGVEMFRRGAG